MTLFLLTLALLLILSLLGLFGLVVGKELPQDVVFRTESDFVHIHELIVNARELLTDLRDTNDSLLNTKQNEIIKDLTLVAFIFYPLTFIAAFFTIPAVGMPFIEEHHGVWVIGVLMIVLAAGIWFFFKKKKWV